MEITFILVEPSVPENVGAAARAIKTMSFVNLRLVNPCNHLSANAIKLAHGSKEILESAKVYNSLRNAIADIDFIIGTSAKARRVKHDYYPVDQLPNYIIKKGSSINSVAIIFGREDRGLSNNETQLCDLISYVPMAADYPSLNLAQAVMVYAYELSCLNLQNADKMTNKTDNILSFKAARDKISSILRKIGVTENQMLFNRIIERTNALNEDDLHLVYSICKFFDMKYK
jgi:tRNA/rRNA methyltransferase